MGIFYEGIYEVNVDSPADSLMVLQHEQVMLAKFRSIARWIVCTLLALKYVLYVMFTTLMPRISMPAHLLILEGFSCQHSLYSGQHYY